MKALPPANGTTTAQIIPPPEVVASLRRHRDLQVTRLVEKAAQLEALSDGELLLVPWTVPFGDPAFLFFCGPAVELLGVGDPSSIEHIDCRSLGRGVVVLGVGFKPGASQAGTTRFEKRLRLEDLEAAFRAAAAAKPAIAPPKGTTTVEPAAAPVPAAPTKLDADGLEDGPLF